MPPLLKIRSERDQMSAIERRIADFLLENAHLLRDYSSQQLADALKISQSSVVKFSQKLGFKGYPDLKYSVGEAVARSDGGETSASARATKSARPATLAQDLWQGKSRAEEETRLINPADRLEAVAAAIGAAGKLFLLGLGEDGSAAHSLALRVALLGITTIHHTDPMSMSAAICAADKRDVLLLLSEHGQLAALNRLSRQFHGRHGKVVSVTRHTANSVRAHADLALLVSAHHEHPHIESLLYQSAQQHLLDLVFVILCEELDGRLKTLDQSRERTRELLEP
jgi:DNA-binding MurR/RpiR family transcriptional regulator